MNPIYWSIGNPMDYEFETKEEAIDYCQERLNADEYSDGEEYKIIKCDFEADKVLKEEWIYLTKDSEGYDMYEEHNTRFNLKKRE